MSKRHIFPSLLPIPSLSSYTSSIPISTSPCLPLPEFTLFSMYGYLNAIQEELPVTGYMQVAEEHQFRLNHALLFFCKHSSLRCEMLITWSFGCQFDLREGSPLSQGSSNKMHFKMHQNSEYICNFRYEVHRCTPSHHFTLALHDFF